MNADSHTAKEAQKKLKTQTWNGVLTVLLVEAKNLSPVDESLLVTDSYVKFR